MVVKQYAIDFNLTYCHMTGSSGAHGYMAGLCTLAAKSNALPNGMHQCI